MSSRLDRIIREVLEGGESTLLEADMSRRLDMLVRQGLMPASQLPILKRGLEKFNQGKVPAPNERNAVNTLLNGMMFIVLGDDTVFNRARTSVQQKKYQTEDLEECKSEEDFKPHMMYDPKTGKGVKAETYEDHVKLDKKGYVHEKPDVKEEQLDEYGSEFARPAEKSPQATAQIKAKMKAKNKLRPKGVQEEEELEENRAAFSGAADRNKLLGKLQKAGKTASEIGDPKERAAAKKELPKIKKQLDTGIKEEEQLDEYGAMSSDKASHDTGGFRISNKDASAAKERAKKKSAEKRDKLSNIIKKNTIQKGPMKGYMTDEVNQGEEKMDIDWTKNPFAQAKAMKEGAFKAMATADAEEQRLRDQKKAKRLSAKKDKEEKETDPGLKTEGVAKNTLDIYQAHADKKKKDSLKVGQKAPAGASKANERQLSSIAKQMNKAVDKANAKLKEDLEGLPELDALDVEMSEAYQSPTKNNYTDKELRQAKGIAFDKRYKGGNMTGAAKAMEKIKKGLSDHPVASKALRQANEENMKDEWLDLFDGVEDFNEIIEMSYKEKFNSMLKKTGKSLAGMSPEEKKKFFNKVDSAHDAVNENKAFRDAARDYAKDDKKGLAPTKKDAPKVSDAKNAKEIEHIVPQMRKAISVGKKVQFKDGKHHTVSKAHAAKFLNKYMSGKPADKEKMQSHAHQSHKHFSDHVK